jgi:hypothetical protein
MRRSSERGQESAWQLEFEGVGSKAIVLKDGVHVLGSSSSSTVLIDVNWPRTGAVISVDGPQVLVEPADVTVAVFVNGQRLREAKVVTARCGQVPVKIGRSQIILAYRSSTVLQADLSPARSPGTPVATVPLAIFTRAAAGIAGVAAAVLVALVVIPSTPSSAQAGHDESAQRRLLSAAGPRTSTGDLAMPADTAGLELTRDARGVLTASGVLTTPAHCARISALRVELGADGFVDKTVCLPTLRLVAEEWLAGTGIAPRLEGERMVLHGRAVDPAVARRLADGLLAAHPGVPLITSWESSSPPVADSDPTADLVEAARAALASRRGVVASDALRSAVILKEGRAVRVGQDLIANVQLAAIHFDGVILLVDKQRIPVAFGSLPMDQKAVSK